MHMYPNTLKHQMLTMTGTMGGAGFESDDEGSEQGREADERGGAVRGLSRISEEAPLRR